METISGFPRRLTQLYSDTKTSCNAVIEQDSPGTQPEVNALHRKYRIQKDRLIAWGLQWSDGTKGKQEDIDDSVERAGLTETVRSVLGVIKDILNEVERMNPPSVHAGAKAMSEKGGIPSDAPAWAASDRSRYQDLATELTTSIDTLYDLSKSRRVQREVSPDAKQDFRPPKLSPSGPVFLSAEYSASDLTLINPATLPVNSSTSTTASSSNLPPKLSPSDLILPEEEPPPYERVGVSSSIQVIGKLRSRNSSTNPWKTDGSKAIETPVLVEYAAFDPTYRITEVTPSLDRLETLLSILRRLADEQSFHGTLTCLGYFEDPKQPRFGLVFELPSFVYAGAVDSNKSLEELRPATLLSVLQTGSKSQHSSNSATPPLEDRFRLAFTLTHTFSKFHGDNFVHKDVNSSNILVFRKSRRQSSNSKALQYALRSPVICSFDLFSEYDISQADTMSTLNIYRHPEDPKFTGEKNKQHGPQFDLYGLGLVLLEIGLWLPLSDLWKPKYTLVEFKQRVEDVYIRRLASKCGTTYMQAVRDCFWAADRIASGIEDLENFAQLYNRICIRLQRCCLLDESEPSFDFGRSDSSASLGQGSAASAPGALVSNPALKRKSISSTQAPELSSSPSHRSAKRWALEKGTEVLERTRSLSKASPRSSPNPSSLSRHGSQRSQHSIRKSISHLISPREEQSDDMDWRLTQTKSVPDDLGISTDSSSNFRSEDSRESSVVPSREIDNAASTIQRAWRATRAQPLDTVRGSMSFRDYKEKITVIQKAWRKRKAAARTNTIQTLLTVATPPAILGCSTTQRALPSLPYPTPEPEIQHFEEINQSDDHIASSIRIQKAMDSPTRPKLRLHPVKFPSEIVDQWHTAILPRLERLIERALKDSDETVSIDLVAVGETANNVRPTIFITCSSAAKVKSLLNRRFRYDESVFDLRVRRGKVRRSKVNRSTRRKRLPYLSMMNTSAYNAAMPVMNPYHQQRPVCGASIGAFRGEHLPPVSYGGVILVDDEPLGMSVHHLLDAPSEDESDSEEETESPGPHNAVLSSAGSHASPWLTREESQLDMQSTTSEPMPWSLEISDDDDDLKSDDEDKDSTGFSDLDYVSDEDSDEEEVADSITSTYTTGDIEGVPLGEGDEIKITQPALDDVDEDFFPNEEDRDDDHLSSHELGYVHASSGIRRWKRDDIVHEIDWALFKLKEERLQPYNLVQGGRRFCVQPTVEQDQREISTKLEQPVDRRHYSADEDEYPNGIVSADSLGGLRVHCFGRTTGLQGGMVGWAMSSVRIYRRKTFARSWYVMGGFGVGGDSGAWVVQNGSHRVIGHVLAWCERNHIAYICPMEVLVEDIKRTLGAKRIYLPGSPEQLRHLSRIAGRAPVSKDDHEVAKLGVAVESLGIVDSAVDMRDAPRARRSRLELPPLNTSGESDKENLPVVRSRMIRMKEGRTGQLGMVGVD